MVANPINSAMLSFPERMILLREELGGINGIPVTCTPCACNGNMVSFVDTKGNPLPRFTFRLPCCNQVIQLDAFGINCVAAFLAEGPNKRLRTFSR